MRTLWLVGFATMCAACGQHERQWIPSPLPDDTAAAVLAIHANDRLRVFAFDLEAEAAIVPEETTAEEARIELLGFTSSLATIGLSPGEIFAAQDGAALPLANQVFAAVVDGESVSSWMAAEISDELLAFRTPRTVVSACDEIDIEVVQLDTTEAGAAVTRVASDKIWIATKEPGEMFAFDGNTTTRLDVSPDLLPVDMRVSTTGLLWMITEVPQRLYSGPIDTEPLRLTVQTATIGQGELSRLLIADDGRIFLISRSGVVRLANDPNPIFSFATPSETDNTALLMHQGALFALTEEANKIVRIDDGQPPTLINIPSGAGGLSLAFIEGIGVLVGTVDSELYRVNGDELELLAVLPVLKIRTILPWGEGVMVGGNTGAIALLVDGEICMAGLQTLEDLALAEQFDGGVMFMPTSKSDRTRAGGQTPMTIVRPRR